MKPIHYYLLIFILFSAIISSCSINEKKEYEEVISQFSLQKATEFIEKYPQSEFTNKIYLIFSEIYWDEPSYESGKLLLELLPEDSQEYEEIFKDLEEKSK